MRKVAVVIGSQTDLPQCKEGLLLLQAAIEAGEIELVGGGIVISSIHRATSATLAFLEDLTMMSDDRPDVLITGAGWANHLTGTSDAYLRYELEDTNIRVVGVAFEDEKDQTHTAAAVTSIISVPGTQVTYRDEQGVFIGADGFARACQFAISGLLPVIKQPEARPQVTLSITEAIMRGGQ